MNLKELRRKALGNASSHFMCIAFSIEALDLRVLII